LHSHSMSAKPQIVRFAVLDERQLPTHGMG